MEVAVLGGGGLTGRCAVRDLAASGVFDRIRVADLDEGLAERAARKAGGPPRVTHQKIDVRDRAQLVRFLRGTRVCVNAVQYRFNLDVMEACLEATVDYLDFGGLFHMTRRQLPLDSRFRDAGLLAVPGMGQVPGISNVLAREAAEEMETVDSVIIRDGWKDLTQGGPDLVFTWSPSTFLDEMLLPAPIWDHGEYREVPAMSDPEEYDFPPPIGRTRLFRTIHSEAATLPTSLAAKKLQHCEWREGGPGIDILRLLAQLGLGSEEPILVDGQRVVPRAVLLALLKRGNLLGYPEGVHVDDVEVTDVEVRGMTHGQPVTRHSVAVFHSRPDWGAAATEYAVGIAGSIAAILIAQGRSTGKGVLPPELSIPAGPLRAMLKERGVETRLTPPDPPLRSVERGALAAS